MVDVAYYLDFDEAEERRASIHKAQRREARKRVRRARARQRRQREHNDAVLRRLANAAVQILRRVTR